MILAENLVKEFSRPKRLEGRFAGLRSFVSTQKVTTRAVDGVCLRIDDGEIVGGHRRCDAPPATGHRSSTSMSPPSGWTWSPRHGSATAHGVCTINFGQHRASAGVVRDGDWDRYLLRPAPPLMQLLTRFFSPGTLGDLVLGVAILAVAASRVELAWTPWIVLYVAAAAIGGGLVEAGLQIGISGLDFRMGPTTRIKDTIDRVLTNFGAYPVTIFGTLGAWLLTFLLPLAFMAYLPATVVLGHTEELVVPLWLAQASPLMGPMMLILGMTVFRSGAVATVAEASDEQ